MRIRTALTNATVGLALAGCSSDPGPQKEAGAEPSSTDTSRASASPSPGRDTPSPTEEPARDRNRAETGFLLTVRHSPDFERQTDEELLAAGRRICSDLDNGATYERAVSPVIADGASEESALILAANAVHQFCQKHNSTIEVELGGPASPQPEPKGDERTAFLAQVREDEFYQSDITDEAILVLGTTVCDGFTRGDSLDVTLGYFEAIPRDSAIAFIEASVTHICPEHSDRI